MERFGTINTRKRLVSDFSKILSFAHRKHYKTKMTASNSQHYQSYPLPITRLSSIRSLFSHNLALARSCTIICSEQADEERSASFKSYIRKEHVFSLAKKTFLKLAIWDTQFLGQKTTTATPGWTQTFVIYKITIVQCSFGSFEV